ncbi:DNA polymerase III subunit delta' [Entomoplasma ellychniae]|uniref:DNA polymerase III subunit delta n=1 Tax=Entomoplasma ellychniae TaxID=2114 RepID=A0A8E2QY86_9MOLU|nr:DNA polymerase III subunit delta [Entomoplasma ellychniae]PPE04790.1 DNA polymerase III subunit delta' [Entomoplasma ellychniae]
MKKIEIKNNLAKLIKENRMFHSIILSGKNYAEVITVSNDLARMFFCEKTNIDNDKCNACKRFLSNNIIDYLKIGDGNLPITKVQVQEIISRFSLTSVEKFNKKVYVIDCAENLKNDAANSLLKFLEEPPKNTFSILLTKNKTDILPTIRSRCNLINVENEKIIDCKNNILVDMLYKNKEDILISNIDIKKIEKSELIKLSEDAYEIIKEKFPLNTNLFEVWLEFILDLKFSISKNISIDNWLINVTEVI